MYHVKGLLRNNWIAEKDLGLSTNKLTKSAKISYNAFLVYNSLSVTIHFYKVRT